MTGLSKCKKKLSVIFLPAHSKYPKLRCFSETSGLKIGLELIDIEVLPTRTIPIISSQCEVGNTVREKNPDLLILKCLHYLIIINNN